MIKGIILEDCIYSTIQNVTFGHIMIEDMLKSLRIKMDEYVKFEIINGRVHFTYYDEPEWFVDSYYRDKIYNYIVNRTIKISLPENNPLLLIISDNGELLYKEFPDMDLYKYNDITRTEYNGSKEEYDKHKLFELKFLNKRGK